MRRRTLCRGVGALVAGIALTGCGGAPALAMPPGTWTGDAPGHLSGLGGAEIHRRLLAARPVAAAAGLAFAGVHLERATPDAPLVACYFTPGYHRAAYAVHGDGAEARDGYAAAVAALRADERGRARDLPPLPYPVTLLACDDVGCGAALVGRVVVHLTAADSRPGLLNALTATVVARPERAVRP